MNRKLIFRIGSAIAIGLLSLCLVWIYFSSLADFILKCLGALGVFGAVLAALFGDYLREKLFPIKLTIEVPDESNDVIDEVQIGTRLLKVYFHHLVVKNLTHHRTVTNCRIWLKKIFVQQINNEWKEENQFAVPRLMEWAPSEICRQQRTFIKQQVFDLGITLQDNGGFKASYDRDQRGAVPRTFPTGKKLRFVFYATADNYREETEFCFEIEIPPTIAGQLVTPSKVIFVKNP